MPAPIELALVGNWLFGAQNHALQDTLFKHPIAMGLQMPGADLCRVYSSLARFGLTSSFDAQKWDACVPLWVFVLIKRLRKLALPGHDEDIERYYNAVYCAWVEVSGNIVQVNGQKSGQTLTASDNSLA